MLLIPVDIDEAVTLLVAIEPAQDVGERPGAVTNQLNPVLQRLLTGNDMALEVGDAIGIVHAVIRLQLVKLPQPVLGDHQRQPVAGREAAQGDAHPGRVYGPVPVAGLKMRIGRRLVEARNAARGGGALLPRGIDALQGLAAEGVVGIGQGVVVVDPDVIRCAFPQQLQIPWQYLWRLAVFPQVSQRRLGAIFLAASMGTTFSTINPFSVVIASNAAGIPFTEGLIFRAVGCLVGTLVVIGYLHWYCKKIKANPAFSYTYEDRDSFRARFLKEGALDEGVPFTLRRKIILTLFILAFPLTVWGVSMAGWWFPQMAASFLAVAIIIMFISGLKEKEAVEAFTQGASELVAVSLIIGLARGVNLVLDQGMISDTILAYASDLVSGMHGAVFAVAQMLVFTLLGLVVPSSSGLAVLSMPIMAPLADTVMIPRYIVVSAYNWGQYAMLFLAPTGLVLVTLQMLGIQFNQWVRFVLPMVGFVLGFGALMLVVQVMLI